MKTRKYKQRGGSKTPYTRREKTRLRRVGFTDDQIRYLNAIKKEYGLDSLNATGIVYLIHENNNGMTPELYTASYDKNIYPTLGDTDNEEDTDDDDNGETQLGGKKRIQRKTAHRYSTKRETRRRRKSIKRTQVARKKTRKSRRRRR
jgi:hypothetical protein